MFRGAIKYVLTVLVAVLAILTDAAPAAAQSDILLQLRSGSPAGDRFRVDSAGGMVALGELGIGIIPTSGCNEVMMWYPYRVAFRAGSTNDGGACNSWDDANIGFYSWAGGLRTLVGGNYSVGIGRQLTVAVGAEGATAFGYLNTISANGSYGFTAGQSNEVSDIWGVALGFNNTAAGDGAIAIGSNNTADANYSVALGHRASTNGFSGSMVLADQSTTDSLEAFATNQMIARYAGGYRFYTNSVATAYCGTGGGASPSWACTSSRTIKENYLPVDVESALTRLQRLPLNTWTMIGDSTRTPHMGLFAEDFHDAFGLGDSDYVIGFQDMDGVLVAGVQALTDRTDALRAEVDMRDARIATLEDRVADLEAQNAALEARLRRIEEALGTAE